MFFQNCVYSLFQATHANLHERLECCGAVARLFNTYRSNFLGKQKVGFFFFLSEILETEEDFFIILELGEWWSVLMF